MPIILIILFYLFCICFYLASLITYFGMLEDFKKPMTVLSFMCGIIPILNFIFILRWKGVKIGNFKSLWNLYK